MRILVTGSAGFIGFHTSIALLDKDYEVIGIDNMNDYYDVKLKEKRNAILCNYPHYHFANIDIRNVTAIDVLFKENSIDAVVHLAAYANVRHSIVSPITYIDNNISGFFNVIDTAKWYGIKRFIYASSSCVYGNAVEGYSIPENLPTDQPLSMYAISKKTNELTAWQYSQQSDMQTIGLRYFTVYGEYGRPDMAVWLFTNAIYNNQTIDLYGSQKRDFAYIGDVVPATVEAIESDKLGKYELINVGSNKAIDLIELISIIAERLNKPIIINNLPMQIGDAVSTCADLTDAKRLLNFEPQTDIVDGVNKFIDWYLEYVQS